MTEFLSSAKDWSEGLRSSEKVRVVGLGQCSQDLFGRVPLYPSVDQKVELLETFSQGGGPVATALVTLSRLGVRTAIASRTGGDDLGTMIRRGLVDEGVDCFHLLVDPSGTSQFAFIAVDPFGHRNIFWTRGSARPLSETEIPLSLIAQSTVVHLDGLHLDAAVTAARHARHCGVTTVLDGGTFRPGTERLLPWIDHLVVSTRFARQVCDSENTEKVLSRLLQWGAEVAVVTRGAEGCFFRQRGETGTTVHHQSAFAIEAVDTTGCGDVFHGGYIYGLLEGWELLRTVRFASACAALKAQSLGGRTAIATRNEVDVFLSRQDSL